MCVCANPICVTSLRQCCVPDIYFATCALCNDYKGESNLILRWSLQHWTVFTEVSEVFILVPALLGLKGNLEMTLASRLSTAVRSVCVCVSDCLSFIIPKYFVSTMSGIRNIDYQNMFNIQGTWLGGWCMRSLKKVTGGTSESVSGGLFWTLISLQHFLNRFNWLWL